MSEFSKGKWYVDSSGVLRSDDEYDRSIAVLYRANATKNIDNANERLIVAVPEMYELLRKCAEDLEFVGLLSLSNECSNLLARIDGQEANAQ